MDESQGSDRFMFLSYAFNDDNADTLVSVSRSVSRRLPRLRTVDAKALDMDEFPRDVTAYISTKAAAILAFFTTARHDNVIYEIGVAAGAGKRVILAGNPDSIPAMLKTHEIVSVVPGVFAWEAKFRIDLEKKLRKVFQIPDDHFVDEKIKRRYSEEEIALMRDRSRNQTAISSIKVADLAKATGILENAIDRHPRDVDAFFLLSDVYYLRGLSTDHPAKREEWFMRQIEVAERGLSVDGSNILLRQSLARGFVRQGKLREAEQILARILSDIHGYSLALYDRACACMLLDEVDDGFRFLAAAIESNPALRNFAKTDPDFSDVFADGRWEELTFLEDEMRGDQ